MSVQVRRYDRTHLSASAHFYEFRAKSCLWLAGQLHRIMERDSTGEEGKPAVGSNGPWDLVGDLYRDLATTQAALTLSSRVAFLASTQPDGVGFEAVSDHVFSRLRSGRLSGDAESIMAHVELHPELQRRLRRNSVQTRMVLTPDGQKLRPGRVTRPARTDDLSTLRRQERIEGATPLELRRDIARDIRDGTLFVAERRGEILGSVRVGHPSARHVTLLGLFVFPEHRGAGIGRAILADVCDRLCQGLSLDVTILVDDDNEAARRALDVVGFKPVAKERTLVYED